MRWLAWIGLGALVLVMACGDDDGTVAMCGGPSDCAPGERCVNGFCVPLEDAGLDAARDTGTDSGSDTGTDSGEEDAGEDAGFDAGEPDAGPCGVATEVGTLEELLAQMPSAYGMPDSPEFQSQRESTGDLRASASLTIVDSDLVEPTDCSGCNLGMFFESSLPGFTNLPGGGIRIEPGAEFRMRFYTGFSLLGPFGTVYFQRPCASLCLGSESRCDEDQACYTSGETYCNACDHLGTSRCACVLPDGSDARNGTSCSYASGDILFAGTCQSGRCVTGPPL